MCPHSSSWIRVLGDLSLLDDIAARRGQSDITLGADKLLGVRLRVWVSYCTIGPPAAVS